MTSLQNDDYHEGVRDGRIASLEAQRDDHNLRLDMHERRLQMQERITYGLIGAIALAEFLPTLRALIAASG